MRALILVVVILLVISAPLTAQNLDILSTIDEILASLSNLKDQLNEITSEVGSQAEQIADLDNTLNEINERWPEIQESAQFVSEIRTKLTPLIEKFPDIEDQLQSLDNIQSSLSDRYEQLNNSLEDLSASISGSSEQDLLELRGQIDALEISLSERDTENQKLSGELNQLRLLTYIGLGILILLLGLQTFTWIRRRPAKA